MTHLDMFKCSDFVRLSYVHMVVRLSFPTSMISSITRLLFLITAIAVATALEAPQAHKSPGKRGLAFAKSASARENLGRPGAEYTKFFSGPNQVTWMYDWEAVIDAEPIDLEFVPMLHSDDPVFTGGWNNAVQHAQRVYRTRYVLSFNEPDLYG